jgi:hypothetical protein
LRPSPILKAGLALVLAVGIFLPLGYYVYTSHPVDPVEREQTSQLFANPRDCQPETGERLTFLTGLAAVPAGIFIFSLGLRRLGQRFSVRAPTVVWWLVELGCGALVLVFCWYAVQEADYYHIRRNLFVRHPEATVPLIVSVLILVMRSRGSGRRLEHVANALALAVVIVVTLAGIFNEGSLGTTIRHFTAVLHPVVQVQFGKALWVDCTSQYGLYAHFLRPLFAVTGLSVAKFTLVMTLLVASCDIAIWVFLREAIRNHVIGLLGFLAMLYGTWFYRIPEDATIWINDPYFQYTPIRLLFPALLVLLAWKYFHRPTTDRRMAITGVLAAGVLWNFDSGLPTFLTWLATLCFAEVLSVGLRRALVPIARHLVAGAAILAGVVALYSVVIYLAYGAWPDYGGFLSYERLFYIAGLAMLPMDWPGTWMAVALVYLAGLTYAARVWVLGRDTTRVKMVFLLSVLGLGLFSYYQGRSHPAVLLLAWWPAFPLMALLLDELVASVRQAAGRPLTWVLASLLVWVLAGFAGAVPADIGSVARLIHKEWPRPSGSTANAVREEARELKRVAGPERQIVILAEQEAILRLLARLPAISPRPFSEMLLMENYEDLCNLLDDKPDLKVYLDKVIYETGGNGQGIQRVLAKLRQEYGPCAETRGGFIFERCRRLLPESDRSLCHVQFNAGPPRAGWECPPVVLGRAFSLEAIVKPAVAFPRRAILSNHCRSLAYQGVAILEKEPTVFQLVIGDGRRWNRYFNLRLPPDQWSYLAIVVDGEVIRARINGELVGEQTVGGLVVNQSPLPMTIGNLVGADWPFVGQIKEVRILDKALSAAEVAATNQETMKEASLRR